MSHEIKEINLRCFIWTIEGCDSTLSSKTFSIQGQECKFEFQADSILGLKITCLRFISTEKLKSPIAATLRVFCNTSNNIILFKPYTLKSENEEIWKHTGISLPDSSLTFEFTIHEDLSTVKKIDTSKSNLPSKEVKDEPLYSNTNNLHLEALSKDFSKLLDVHLSSDVEVTCDSKTFNVHKIVLSTRSEVFSKMLNSSMVEGTTGQIKVEDCKVPIFQSFLRYLYTGKLPDLSLESATQLYEISDKYGVLNLRRACSEFLTNHLTEENASEILILADQHSDEDFRKNVVSYIIDKNIPQRERHWSNFCKNHCSLANEVMLFYIQKQCSK